MTGSIAGRLVVVVMVGVLSSGPAFAGSHEGATPAPDESTAQEAAPVEGSGGKKAPDTEADDAAAEKQPPPSSKREGS